jgi:5' nucleotidase, deoxy (Pyrimidine), cytosolic type C protein (NT5C)
MFQYEWVKQHLGKSALRRVILTCDKTLVNGDLLIDDRPAIKGLVFKFLVLETYAALVKPCHQRSYGNLSVYSS